MKVSEHMKGVYIKLHWDYNGNWAENLALRRLGVARALLDEKVLNKAALTSYTLADWGKKLLVRMYVLWFLFWSLVWDAERRNQTVGEAEYISFNINIVDCTWTTQILRRSSCFFSSTIYYKISTNYIVWLKTVPLNLHDWIIL